MQQHLFILSPGRWLGEGKIHLNMIEEELPFFTRWKVAPEEDGFIECTQEIQIKGLSDIMVNYFRVSALTPLSFSIFMENHAIGKVDGIGMIKEETIGWEFRVKDLGFEGFELYEKLTDDTYRVHGEFATVDQFRTTLHGKIWKQAMPSLENKKIIL